MIAKKPSQPGRMLVYGLLVLLFANNSINADTSCSKGCSQTDNGFLKYSPGNVYEYNFDTILTISLSADGNTAAESEDTTLKLLGTAKVFAEGNCGYTLQLSTIKVSATREAVEKKIAQSIQKPVRFTLSNGKIEPEICVDSNENTYSLNIKRGIISLLQSSIDNDVTEIDVFGQCPTHTTVTKVGNSEVITKVRNLNSCSHRERINSGIIRGVIDENAGIKSTQLLKASYAKEIKLENGLIGNVNLVEEYSFAAVPSNKNNVPGVRAKAVTTLKLKNGAGSPSKSPECGSKSTIIIFQRPDNVIVKNLAALKSLLSEVVQLVDDYVHQNSAQSFIELIRLMRLSDTETLLELSAIPHPNKVLARKVYLDALFRVGTSDSARAIFKQLSKFNDKERTIALLSLNLVQNVDKDTITQATNLLNNNADKEIFLAVGSLISKYCQSSNCESSDIENISKKFADNLKHCKANTINDEKRLLYVIKGIGNSADLAKSLASALTECVSASGRTNRIRVAALQAFETANCDPSLQSKALDLLRDRNEDAELRIEAYLAAVSCPSANLVNDLTEIINQETVNQVGGFITSHLRVIRDSTDTSRAQQKQYLSSIRVTKKFPQDFRRFSYNNEVSYRLDALGIGSSIDYKLIYSQNGFLPRSARLNVTSEIFGTDFNIFEINVRQENIETLLEYYIGPKGLLNNDFDETVKLVTAKGAGGRARRSIADDSAKFAKKYKTYNTKNIRDLNLDLSLKLFGSELLFLSLGDSVPATLDEILELVSNSYDKVKKELKSFNKVFTAHNLFLDTELVYPTGAGIPLELSAAGFSATKLDIGLNIDLEAIIKDHQTSSSYRIKLVPSADVNVNLKFAFNAFVLSTGVKVASSLQSATGADVTFVFNAENNEFNVDVELPREKIELVDLKVNTNIFIAEQDKSIRLLSTKNSKRKNNDPPQTDCFNQAEVLGVQICVVRSNSLSANNILDVTQPLQLGVYLISERKFNLKAQQIQKSTGVNEYKLLFSTPGSKNSHDITVALELGTVAPKFYSRLSLNTNQNNIAGELGVNNDNNELVLYGLYDNNGNVKKHRVGFSKNGNEYRPIIQIEGKNGVIDEINGYRVDGKFVVQKSSDKHTRVNFDNLLIANKDNDRLLLNGVADIDSNTFKSELHVSSNQNAYLIKTNAKIDDNRFAVGIFVNNEKTPDSVFGGSTEIAIKEDSLNLDLVGRLHNHEVKTTNVLEFSKNPETGKITSRKFKNNLTLKNKNAKVIDINLSGLTEGERKVEVAAQISTNKNLASLDLRFNGNDGSHNDYVLEVNGKLNKNFVDLLSKSNFNGNHYVIENVLTSSFGTSITVKGEFGQRYTLQDIFIDVQGTAQLTSKDKPTQILLKVLGTPEKTTGDLKLTRDNVELLKGNYESQHPQDKITAGKLNVIVRNLVAIKSDLKVAKNGKGELNAQIETQSGDNKYKVEVNNKFLLLAPKYEVETNLVLNGKRQIYLKTENVWDKAKVSTKNTLNLLDDKEYTFEANGQVKGEYRLNGEILGSFALKTPENQIIDGSIKRKVTTNPKTGLASGSAEIQLNDSNNGQKRSLSTTIKLDKLNVKSKELSVDAEVNAINYNNEKVNLNIKLKHLPKNANNKFVDLSVNIVGDKIGNPINLQLNIDDYDIQHATFRFSGRYGTVANVNLNGNYQVGVQGQKPCTYELQGNVQVPQSSLKSFNIQTNGKLLRPDKEGIGNYLLELNVDAKSENQAEYARLNTLWKGSRQQGSYNLLLETTRLQQPLKLDGSYQREQSKDDANGILNGKQNIDLNISYGNKYIKSAINANYISASVVNLILKLDSSIESIQNINLNLRGERVDASNYEVNVQAQQNNDVYVLDSKLFNADHKKGLDLRVTLPKNQNPIVLIGVFEILGERKVKYDIDLQNLNGIDFKVNAEAAYNSIDDFYIIGNLNSNKLNPDNYKLDVHTEGKSILLKLQNADGIVFEGNAKYVLKREKNRAIIEGKGQLQYKGQPQTTEFKLIRQNYDLKNDKEVGFSYTFNGNIGPKTIVSTLKITDKDINVKSSHCEEKNKCTNYQLQSIVEINADDQKQGLLLNGNHMLLISIDFRELGLPYTFNLKSKTSRAGLSINYDLDAKLESKNGAKYQLIANAQPVGVNIELKLPSSRQIVFELKHELPTKGIFGRYENTASFYFDKKNKPNEVTQITSKADLTGIENYEINALGELKLTHPTIRPLKISGKLDLNREQRKIDGEITIDIFRLPEQQILFKSLIQNTRNENSFNVTNVQSLSSKGLNIHYEVDGHVALDVQKHELSLGGAINIVPSNARASAYFLGSLNRFNMAVFVLDQQIFEGSGDVNRQKLTSKIESKLQLLGQKPIELKAEVQRNQANINLLRPGSINAIAELKLGKEARVNIVNGDKQLVDSRVALDAAHFLQITHKSDEAAIKEFLNNIESEIKQEVDSTIEKIKKQLKDSRQDLNQQLQIINESNLDLKALKENLLENLQQIGKEIENDATLQDISNNLRQLFGKVATLVEELAKILSEFSKNVEQAINATYEQLQIIIRDTLVPAYEKLAVVATKALNELRISLTSLLSDAFQLLVSILDKYSDQLKNYAKIVGETLKPLLERFEELQKLLASLYEELSNELTEYITKLPTFEALQKEVSNLIGKLKLLDHILIFIDKLQTLSLTPEISEFLNSLRTYVSSKLNNEKVDDAQIIQNLLNELIKALRTIFNNIELGDMSNKAGLVENNLGLLMVNPLPTALIETLSQLPAILSFRLSIINTILNVDLRNLLVKEVIDTFVHSYQFGLSGHVVDGKHIFTFDGQYFVYSGSCKYILAQDSVDNNFTVVAQLNNGKLKAIILADRDGNYLELNDAGVLKNNGNNVEFPQHSNNMHAWRLFYTIHLRSEFGVTVSCTTDLKICHIDVNGFYISRTRGLLGNGNAEPFDDYIKVDGTLAAESNSFGNGYGLGKCNSVSNEKNADIKRTEICDELFSYESTLIKGYMILNPSAFRSACDVAVSSVGEKEEENAACTIATAYASALRNQKVPIKLPKRCLKCTGGADQREIGQEFTVKLPNNKADVVFVVDVGVSENILRNLVAPIITDLRDTLKARSFTDVQIGVVAYNESERYPALLTSDNGKINYQGNIADVKLNGPTTFCQNCIQQIINDKKIWDIYEVLERVIKDIVPQSGEFAFKFGLDYPFRAAATKSIVAVQSNSVELKNLFKLLRAHSIASQTNFNGAILHVITPVQGLALEGVPTEKLIGFNSRLVATLDGKDAKKRPKLQFKNDISTEFVLNSGGWVFATNSFDNLKGQEQKKALSQIINSIADTSFKTELISECTCVPVHGIFAQHKCSIKSSTFLPNKKVKAA